MLICMFLVIGIFAIVNLSTTAWNISSYMCVLQMGRYGAVVQSQMCIFRKDFCIVHWLLVLLQASQNSIIAHIFLALYGALGLIEICFILLQYILNEVIDMMMNDDRFMNADVLHRSSRPEGGHSRPVLTTGHALLVWASLNRLNSTLRFLRKRLNSTKRSDHRRKESLEG
jgi:hypothetical protein